MKIGVVSGMPRETACLKSSIRERHKFNTSTGVGAREAERVANAFVDAGVSGLMSFGVAGGLSADVPAGTIVLANTVLDGEFTHLADKAWLSRLEIAIMGQCPFVIGPVIGTDKLVPSVAGKQEILHRKGAIACDMESHAVARVAALHDLPFAVVRAISDPYDRNVPDWLFRCLTSVGEVQLLRLFFQASLRPLAWRELLNLGLDAKKAFSSLRRVAFCLGPGLRF